MNKIAIAIDGNSLMYRVFYATQNQLDYYKKHNLPPVNALKTMILITLKLIHSKKYDYGIVAFDSSKKTLRHEEFLEYKAKRKPMPEQLVSQIPLIKEALNIIGFQTLTLDGIEADDIIGSFVKKMNEANVNVEIFSSDKDFLQLINHKTCVRLLKTGISDIHEITLENFKNNFWGLQPEQVIDFKGISGDSSDNLSGVSGIGPKTASELLIKYSNLEGIYDNLDKLSESQKNKFIKDKQHAFLCKKLSTINMDVDFNNIDFILQPINKKLFKDWINCFHFQGFDKYLNI